MELVKVKELSKIYHTPDGEVKALDNISFSINKGEVVSIVGPSGCGKSTILSILDGLSNKSSGDISYSKDLNVAYMLQNDCLLPFRTILDNCMIGLEVKGLVNYNTKKYVMKLLEKYGLYEFKDKYPDSLSGGMRQRVALIRTIASRPDLLLLDEATSALDYQSKLMIEEDIYSIIKEKNITSIMVTHDIGEAISMSDRVIVLSGRPAHIKNIYNIDIDKLTPIDKRRDSLFSNYFDIIWRDLDE